MKHLITTWDSPQHGPLPVHYNWLRNTKEANSKGKMLTQAKANKRFRERKKETETWIHPAYREEQS